MLAGQHFRFDESAGQRLGFKVGDFVWDRSLKRVRSDGPDEKQ